MSDSSHFDAIVIGSGHNGLVAAAYLAKAGQRVLVLERSSDFGGATTSQRVFPDFDAWLSRYSYLISLFPQQIVDELGLTFQTRRRSVASFTPYMSSAGEHRGLLISNDDPDRSRNSLRELTGSDDAWKSWSQFTALQQTLARRVWPSLLEPLRSRQQFADSLCSAEERAAWTAIVERPLGEVLERLIPDDLVRGLLFTDAKIGVFTDPHNTTLLQNRCFLYHVIGQETGEWRVPVRGMRSLVDSLLTVCRRHGVKLLSSASATRVEPGRGLHTVRFEHAGVELHATAPHVLINAGPRTFARLLDTAWSPVPDDEGSVIKMNVLLSRLPRIRARGITPTEAFTGSLHLNEGYQQMLRSWQQASRGELPDPAPCETYCHTLTDPSILSPELQVRGYHTLTLFGLDMPHRLFTHDHDARLATVRDRYLQALDGICDESFVDCLARDRDGQPCLEIKSPVDLEQELGLDLGNIFHNAPSWFFTDDPDAVGTWGVETAWPGIVRAGSAAVRGGAVSGIPGRNAAMSILQPARS